MIPADRQIAFLLYDTPDNTAQVQVVVRDETIWMTQKAMAMLFDVNVPAISKHLKNIFESGELNETTTVSKMEIVVNRGFRGEVTENVDFYNLDAIISVGYRVNSTLRSRVRHLQPHPAHHLRLRQGSQAVDGARKQRREPIKTTPDSLTCVRDYRGFRPQKYGTYLIYAN